MQGALPQSAWLVIRLNCDASANGELTTPQGCPSYSSEQTLSDTEKKSAFLQPLPIGLALSPRATQHGCVLFRRAALNLPGNRVICVPLASSQSLPLSLGHHDFQTVTVLAASISPSFHSQHVTPRVKHNTLLSLPSRDR